MKRGIRLALTLSCAALISCGKWMGTSHVEKVEISPGVFLEVEKWDWTVDDAGSARARESTKIRLAYRGTTIEWHDVDIPVTMREWEGRLYMIGYDRETGRRGHYLEIPQRLRYFRQEAGTFKEIPPQDFPKKIATQNMWLRGLSPEACEAEIRLKTDDVNFPHGLTAQIWRQLYTGVPYYSGIVDQAIIDEFKKKYEPIPLTGGPPPASASSRTANGA